MSQTQSNQTLLVIDDDVDILSAIKLMLRAEEFQVICAESPTEGLACLSRQSVDLILTDLNFSMDTTSGEEGLELIAKIREKDELTPIVVMTGWGTIEVAVNSMQKGANDFIQKPWENHRLLATISNQILFACAIKQSQKLNRQNQLLEEELGDNTNVIAKSEIMLQVMQMIDKVAQSDVNVLITGENGTGKSLIAKYIHQISARKNEPFAAVNMGAVTESLFESELFGHVKGAFTDAKSSRIGRFELADNGTLFLDEIANTPYSQQGKLLRVLEESQFEKVGSSKTQSVDIRLISATNANLHKMIEEGEFRKDLFYRINTIEIEIPPLKSRIDDIIPLAELFLTQIATQYNQAKCEISQAAKACLINYSWPGNVRELSHVMQRAQILCVDNIIQQKDLGLEAGEQGTSQLENMDSLINHNATLEEIELKVIQSRLEMYSGNALQAAESLGLSRSAFYRRLEKLKE